MERATACASEMSANSKQHCMKFLNFSRNSAACGGRDSKAPVADADWTPVEMAPEFWL